LNKLSWKDIKKLPFNQKGLIRTKTRDICFICKKPTYIVDIDFQCHIHPKCQVILVNDYLNAEHNGLNKKGNDSL
jgi:hypothetical protein